MADFFTRLSERAMGRTPTAEPSIAPRFAADATMINTSTEPIEEELTTTVFRPESDPQKREKVPKPWLATRDSNGEEKQSAHRSSISGVNTQVELGHPRFHGRLQPQRLGRVACRGKSPAERR